MGLGMASGDNQFTNCVLTIPRPVTGQVHQPQAAAGASRQPAVIRATGNSTSSSALTIGNSGDLSMMFGSWPTEVSEAWRLLRPGQAAPPEGSPASIRFKKDLPLRAARSSAHTMAGLILSLPGFEEPAEALPGCVIDWLCRFFR